MGSAELLDHLLTDNRDTDGDEALKTAHLALCKQFWGRLQPLPGARDLMRECASWGLRVVHQRAGVPFVALTCGGTSEAELRNAGAGEVWCDPADLLAHLVDSSLASLLG